MANKDSLQAARDASIQERAREGRAGLSLLLWLGAGDQLVAPWWSRTRDAQLRNFWRKVDYLAGAIYTMESRMVTIPFRVEARDMAIKSHVKQAEEFTRLLVEEAEFGGGWGEFYSKFVEDLLSQDNGCFGEIIGDGKPDGPIQGRPLGIAHLDAAHCRRTSDPEFPVVYEDTDGKRYKLHFTRVVFTSHMPSPAVEMHAVGFCAVSRCINIAQTLLDQLIFKQERLGSRPQRQMLITTGGLDPEDIRTAFAVAEEAMDSQALRRYSKTVVVGSDDIPDAGVQEVDFASLPDGFDENTSVTLGMSAIALALGVDPRELWPGLQAGATRAEALIAHIKQRGKGPGHILETTERLINQKFLPPQLELVFDFQDDAQDRSVAEIKKVRSDRHIADVAGGLIDIRTAREQMLNDGDLDAAQFVQLELANGRLEDGSDVVTLFANPEFAEDLDLGVPSPMDTEANEAADMLEAIKDRRRKLEAEFGAANPGRKANIQAAMAALDKLQLLYGGMSARLTMPGARPKPAEKPAETEPGGEAETATPPELGPDDLRIKEFANGREEAIEQAARAIQAAAERIATDGRREDLFIKHVEESDDT